MSRLQRVFHLLILVILFKKIFFAGQQHVAPGPHGSACQASEKALIKGDNVYPLDHMGAGEFFFPFIFFFENLF